MIYQYRGFNRENVEVRGETTANSKREALNNIKNETDIITIHQLKEKTQIPIISNLIEKFQKKRSENKSEQTSEKEGEDGEEQSFLKRILSMDIGGSTKQKAPPLKDIKIDWSMVDEDREMSKEALANRNIRVTEAEVIIFTKRLEMMLSSGIALSRALDILSDHPNQHMEKIIRKVIDDINEGTAFSTALSDFPKQFNYTYIAMITIGEDSGNLPRALNEIAEYMDRNQVVKGKVRTASIYPVIISSVLLVTLVLGSIFFIPQFKDMFSGEGQELPFFTQIVFGISDAMPQIIFGLIIAIVVVHFLRKYILRFDRLIRTITDRLKLRAPIIKDINLAAYMYNVASTIHIMISSGIRLKDTIDMTRRTINNIYIQNDLGSVSDLMVEGYGFSEALEKQKTIDPLLTSMVLTGEETGNLERALFELAEHYNYELNKLIDNAMETVQPILMIVVGLIAIPVIIAVYLPIFDISTGTNI